MKLNWHALLAWRVQAPVLLDAPIEVLWAPVPSADPAPSAPVEHVGATEDFAVELAALPPAEVEIVRPSVDVEALDIDDAFGRLIAGWRVEPDWLSAFKAETTAHFGHALVAEVETTDARQAIAAVTG